MNDSLQLEDYLRRLEETLSPMAVAERAAILLEVKNQVTSKLEQNSHETMYAVLHELGEPKKLGQYYLSERGLKAARGRSLLKWLAIFFLGFFALIAIFIFVVFNYFGSFMKGSKSMSLQMFNNGMQVEEHVNKGSEIIGDEIQLLGVEWANAKIEVEPSSDREFRWSCKSSGPLAVLKENSAIIIDLKNAEKSKCEIRVPSSVALHFVGANGKVELEHLANPVDLHLENGEVEFEPADKVAYRYDLQVTSGKVDDFTPSADPNAYLVKIKLINGKIRSSKD